MKFSFKRINPAKAGAAALGLVAAAAMVAHAGTDTTFSSIATTLTNWAEGSLGLVFALAATIIGVGVGVLRASPATFIGGPALGLAIYFLPTILPTLVSATNVAHSVLPLIAR